MYFACNVWQNHNPNTENAEKKVSCELAVSRLETRGMYPMCDVNQGKNSPSQYMRYGSVSIAAGEELRSEKKSS